MYKKVVVLGGGTGMSYLLKGLKDFPVDITAIITVSDNGRSTGKLREEFHTPAVGDIRKVITNLSQIDQPIKDMMSYRFKTSSDLDGHAVGNLILTAMLDITGSLTESIKQLSKLLDVRHKVLPISEAISTYAQQKARLRKAGTQIEDLDLFIGSTAIAYNLVMVTENVKHFEVQKGIEIENWVKR